MDALAPDPFRDLPRRHYGMIVADPPWRFQARTALQVSSWNSRRDAEKHYASMGIEEIKALPVRDLAASNAHLLLWTTGPCLPAAFEVITAWGFRYSSVGFTWIKLRRSLDVRQLRLTATMESDLHVGLGLTTRKNAEFCLLARRGNARRLSKNVREVIMAPVREHSRKPDEFYLRAQQYAAGPYLDLFARQRRPGWDSWGNDVDRFTPVKAAA